MTITFENDKDIIVYTFEKILLSSRERQLLFAAHCVLWLAAISGSPQGLLNHIDSLPERAELGAKSNPQDIRDEQSMTSGSADQDIIHRNCEEFLQEFMSKCKVISYHQMGYCKRLNTMKKNRKDCRAQIKRISKKEIHHRAIARECQPSAWPLDRPGAHRTTCCVNSVCLVKGTPPSG